MLTTKCQCKKWKNSLLQVGLHYAFSMCVTEQHKNIYNTNTTTQITTQIHSQYIIREEQLMESVNYKVPMQEMEKLFIARRFALCI